MSDSSSWQRQLARRLVRHAAAVLRSARPSWSNAMESELENIADDHDSLLWALGCVRAGYSERLRNSWGFSMLLALITGVAFALTQGLLSGVVAAVTWPRLHSPFAQTHLHLLLTLYSVIAVTVPISVVAARFGRLLARLSRRSSVALPIIAIAAWLAYLLSPLPSLNIMPSPTLNTFPHTTAALLELLARWPVAMIASVLLPGCAFLLGYRSGSQAQQQQAPGCISARRRATHLRLAPFRTASW